MRAGLIAVVKEDLVFRAVLVVLATHGSSGVRDVCRWLDAAEERAM